MFSFNFSYFLQIKIRVDQVALTKPKKENEYLRRFLFILPPNFVILSQCKHGPRPPKGSYSIVALELQIMNNITW